MPECHDYAKLIFSLAWIFFRPCSSFAHFLQRLCVLNLDFNLFWCPVECLSHVRVFAITLGCFFYVLDCILHFIHLLVVWQYLDIHVRFFNLLFDIYAVFLHHLIPLILLYWGTFWYLSITESINAYIVLAQDSLFFLLH